MENRFALIFEDVQKKEMCASSLSYVCEKEQVGEETDKTISALSKRGQYELLTFDGGPICK